MNTLQWCVYLFVNLGISACYFTVPVKLFRMMRSPAYIASPEAGGHRAYNLTVMGHFIVWCGIHHLFMVPLMFLLMKKGMIWPFYALVAIDSVVAAVSLRAALWLKVPKDA